MVMNIVYLAWFYRGIRLIVMEGIGSFNARFGREKTLSTVSFKESRCDSVSSEYHVNFSIEKVKNQDTSLNGNGTARAKI